ncbi:uncharacterized protein [Littorina saxatilis]|uniref:uncharacterized protein n=1 Tax=Littorina saxatilis TaxID=31220 RepID=UPI0038B69880
MTVVRLTLVIFIVFHEANTINAMCYSSLSCDFESTYCQFEDGSHGPDTDTWIRGLKWEMLHGHKGNFVFAHKNSQDMYNSGLTTVDMTSPLVCSGGAIQVSFEYIVNRANSQLQVLTRCDGKDTTDVHTYSDHDPTWKTGNVTLQPCLHGDTEVVFSGSLNERDSIGVDTVSIVTGENFAVLTGKNLVDNIFI